jgi:hypothetical protein
VPQPQPVPQASVCPACGANCPPDNRFCVRCGYQFDNDNDYDDTDYDDGDGDKTNIIAVLLVGILCLILAFTAFNFLVMRVIDVSNSPFLQNYKNSLSELLNISIDEDESEEDISDENGKRADKKETTTEPTVFTTTTTVPVTVPYSTTAATAPQPGVSTVVVPEPITQYASGLTYANRDYKISLANPDSEINYRSTPQIIAKDQPNSNIVGKLKHGDVIHVEFIYNGTWAVFQKDGKYVFASIYMDNNPNNRTLMQPV